MEYSIKEKKQFKNNFIWNTIGSGLNAFNSLFFLIIVTRINGLEVAGVFTIGFSTACILYAVGIYAGRIYQVTELNKRITDIDFIANRGISCMLVLFIVLFFCKIRGYGIDKTIVFFLLAMFKVLEAFSDVLYGIFQKNERLDVVGKSLFLKSLMSIIVFFIVDFFTKNMMISIFSMVVINIIMIWLYDIEKVKKYIKKGKKINFGGIKKIFKGGFFVFAISFLGMYVLNAQKYSIDQYLGEKFQTIYGIIIMPATVMALVSQFLIHPYLTQIVKLYEERNLLKLKQLLRKIFTIIFVFGGVATIGGYLLGTQLLGIIYGVDLSKYKNSLAIILISSTLYTVGTVCSSVLTTVRKNLPQFIIYLVLSIVAFVMSMCLIKEYEIRGAVISYFCVMLLQVTLYLIYIKMNIKKVFNIEGKGR